MTESRELTQQEVQAAFMDYIATMVRYWGEMVPAEMTAKERLGGLAHSILTLLDGGTLLPTFELIPQPHPDDKAFCQEEGDNWWPCPELPEGTVTVHGDCVLHELWAKMDPYPLRSR